MSTPTPGRPTLRPLLDGYRNTMLSVMAAGAGVAEQGRIPSKSETARRLADHFRRAQHVRAVLADLDPVARRLLERVQRIGGRAQSDGLADVVAAEGIAEPPRTERRNSWESPQWKVGNPAGTSGAFQDVVARLELQGLLLGQEPRMAYNNVLDFGLARWYVIPSEVWAHLPPVAAPDRPPPAQFARTAGADAALTSRELFILWSYLWHDQPSLLTASAMLAKRDLKQLAAQMPYDMDVSGFKSESEARRLYIARHILMALKLVAVRGTTLLADEAAAREHWALPLTQRAAIWLAAWQHMLNWNELSRLPGISWRPAHNYERDQAHQFVVAARSHLVKRLVEAGRDGEWQSWPVFLADLRLSDRDFLVAPQRHAAQGHRYDTYSNARNWSFSGVHSDNDGWQRVETAFVVQVLDALHWLGLADLGYDAKGLLAGYRLSPVGRHLLAEGPPPPDSAGEGARVVVQPNFHILAIGPVPETALFDLEHFAERRSADRAISYVLTRESVYRAQRAGIAAGAILARLQALSGMPVPQNVARTITEWQSLHERIVLTTNACLVQTADPAVLDELVGRTDIAAHNASAERSDPRGRSEPAGHSKPAARVTGDPAWRRLSPTVAVASQPGALPSALAKAELAPARRSLAGRAAGVGGRATLRLAEDGRVAIAVKVPDVYVLGWLQRLAVWDEALDSWCLTRASVQTAQNRHGQDAEAQIAIWRRLLAPPAPAWLDQRIKAWSGHYGQANIYRAVVVELPSEDLLDELNSRPDLMAKLYELVPEGPLLVVGDADEAGLVAWLNELGVSIKEQSLDDGANV